MAEEMDVKQLKNLTTALVEDTELTKAFLNDPNKVARRYGIKFDKEEEGIIKESGKMTLSELEKAGAKALFICRNTDERTKSKEIPKTRSF